MRAIYLYGPLFHNPQNFNFKLVDVDNTYYTFEFSTKPTCYPQKTKLLCRGIAKINRQCLRLKSLDFEYLDYQLFTLQRSDSQKPPYVTKAYVEFDYDQENHAYISYCATETIWKYITNYQSGTFAVEHPSRPFAAQNHLVEREIWKCSIYTPIPEKLRTKETAIQAQYANCSWGIYKPELLKKYPNPFANEQAIEDLNKYMPLEQQYRHNSKKFYQYYNGINLDPQYSLIQEAKRILLNLFAIQE